MVSPSPQTQQRMKITFLVDKHLIDIHLNVVRARTFYEIRLYFHLFRRMAHAQIYRSWIAVNLSGAQK